MAYVVTGYDAPIVTVRGGRRHVRWVITETGASPSSEFVLDGAPDIGEVYLYQATLTAGTGTTINPILGRAAAFTANTQNHIGTNATTAARINDGTPMRYQGLTASKVYVRSVPNNAAGDHAISTEIVIVEGLPA